MAHTKIILLRLGSKTTGNHHTHHAILPYYVH